MMLLEAAATGLTWPESFAIVGMSFAGAIACWAMFR